MMQRMQVYLPEDLFIDLKTRAAVEDVAMSELIRKGLKKVLLRPIKKTDPMKVFVGRYQAKIKTNAVQVINGYYQKV